MATSGAVRAGRAFVEFFADDSQFVRKLKSMEKDFQAWGKRFLAIGAAITGVGSAIAGAMLAAARSFATVGDTLAKMHQRTNVSVEALSTLQYAAESCGASIGDIESAMGKVRGDLIAFAKGNWSAAEGLYRLGVNAIMLARLKPEDQFLLLADRISKIKHPLAQAAAAQDIFGGSADKLMPLIRQGADGMAQMRDRARALGIVMSGTTATAGETLTQSFYDLQVTIRGLWNQIGAALTPDLVAVSGKITDLIAKASAWAAENQELIRTVFKLSAGLVAVGSVVTGIGGGMLAASFTFGKLAAAAGMIRVGLLAVGKAATFLLGPWGMLLRLVTLGTVAFFKFTNVGQQLGAKIGQVFTSLAGQISGAWGGIVDAIKAGDFELAGKIAFLGLQLLWLKVTNVIRGAWDGVVKYLLDRFDGTTSGFRTSMVNAWAAIQSAAVLATAGMADAWDYLTTFLANAWQSSGVEYLVRFLQEEWNRALTAIQNGWQLLVETAVDVWNHIDEYTAIVLQAIADGFQVVADAWAAVVEVMSAVWNMFCDGVQAVWVPVQAVLSVGFDVVAGIWSGVVWAMGDVWKAFVDTLAPYLQPFVDTFNTVAGYIQGVFQGLTDFIGVMWSSLMDGMLTDLRGAQAWIAKGIAYITAKIQGVDPAEVMQEIDDQLARDRAADAAANAERNQARDARIQQRAVQTGAQLTGIEQQRQTDVAAVNQPAGDRMAARQSAYDSKAAAAAAQLAKAQDDLEEAKFQAERARKIAELERRKKAEQAGQGVAEVAGATYNFGAIAKDSTSGTFSADAAARMGGTDPMLTESRLQTGFLREIANKSLAFG